MKILVIDRAGLEGLLFRVTLEPDAGVRGLWDHEEALLRDRLQGLGYIG